MHLAKSFCILLIFTLILTIGTVYAVSYAYVNSFSGDYVAWTESGSSPYLDAIGGGTIATSTNLANEGNFGFPATSGVTSLEFYAKISNAAGDDGVNVQTELGGELFFPTSTSYAWYSVSKSDDSAVLVTYANGLNTPHRTITIDAARLVYSTGGATYTKYSIGTVFLHGYSIRSLNILRQSSGTILLNGWSSINRVLTQASVGSIFLNGYSSISNTFTRQSIGNIILEGTSILIRTYDRSSLGTLVLQGYSALTRIRMFSSQGILLLEGVSSLSRILLRTSVGTILLEGLSTLTLTLAPRTYELSSVGTILLQGISSLSGTIISPQSSFLLLLLFFLTIFGMIVALTFAYRLEKHDD